MKTITITLQLDEENVSKDNIVINLKSLTASEGPNVMVTTDAGQGFLAFMEQVATQMKQEGHVRTAEAYRAAQLSLQKFCNGSDFDISHTTASMMNDYEAWLHANNVKPNSSSFYMRILRAVYNRAVEAGLTTDQQPFKKVYTGIAKTKKRAIDLDTIRRLEALTLNDYYESLSRDLFMFSFYTRGMSFVDMAYLKRGDIKKGVLTYKRQKTGQVLHIKWEQAMQRIVDENPSETGIYLLPIIHSCNGKERNQYRHRQRKVNEALRRVSNRLGLNYPITMYVARHSWATIASQLDIPLSVISLGMGHNSEKTTRIYLKEIDDGRLDAANSRVLKALAKGTGMKTKEKLHKLRE